jgi:hypothetical protein
VRHYNVVLAGSQTQDGFDALGSKAAVRSLVASAGGTIVNDLTTQIGVLTVASSNVLLDETLRGSALVVDAGEDFAWKALPEGGPTRCRTPENRSSGTWSRSGRPRRTRSRPAT